MSTELLLIPLDEFNAKVAEYAKTNFVLTNLFGNPKSKIETWEQLPAHLIQDLFKKIGCKPIINKY
jgi:hypothetical protein